MRGYPWTHLALAAGYGPNKNAAAGPCTYAKVQGCLVARTDQGRDDVAQRFPHREDR